MNRQFNLLNEEWLPCITSNGQQKEFGIRQILQQAPDIRELYGDTPLTTIALHRLLLAVLHTVFKISGPKIWQTLWQQKQWPGKPLDAYFEAHHDRFYLFDDKYPFYQITDEHIARIKRQLVPNSKKHKPETVSILAEDRASGKNKTLFDHTMDGLTLLPAEAARRLMTTQVYSLSSSQSGVPGVKNLMGPCTRGMVFLIEGENLFETLMLNLILYTEDRPIPVTGNDRPVWELEEPPAPDQNQPYGYIDYLTWQNRRIKLLPEEKNGQLMVKQVCIFPGRGLDKSVEDPMMAFKLAKDDKRKEIRLNPSRALWRDSTALLSLSHPGEKRLCPDALNWVSILVEMDLIERDKLYHLKAFGMKTNRGGLIEIQRHETIPLPVVLFKDEELPPMLRSALKTAERFGDILRYVERTLFLELGLLRMEDLKNYQQVEKAHNIFKLTYLYWSRLESEFQQFIRDLPNSPDQALAVWQQTLLQCVRTAFREGTTTLVGIAGNSKALAMAHNQLEHNLWAVRKNWESIEQEETFEISKTSKV